MNGYAKTALLLAAMTALFLAVGFVLGGEVGLIIALVVALGMNLFAYWNADKVVLRMQGAVEADRSSAPDLHDIVAGLAGRADLPMPKVYLIESEQPNAFATGRNPENAAVAATTGLLRMLDRDEVAAVMAHELGHVKNRDTLIMTIAATLAGAIGLLANFALFFGGRREGGLGIIGAIAMAVLAPLAAMLVQTAISRSREYQADKAGAEISGDPAALASALRKIEYYAEGLHNPHAEQNPAAAHLFIINPLSGGSLRSLFSTHPATDDRIERLEALAAEMGPNTHGMGARNSMQTGSVPTSGGAGGPWGRRPGPWG